MRHAPAVAQDLYLLFEPGERDRALDLREGLPRHLLQLAGVTGAGPAERDPDGQDENGQRPRQTCLFTHWCPCGRWPVSR